MYRIWCEWDIGAEDLLFKSKEKAIAWLKEDTNFLDAIEYENIGKEGSDFKDVDDFIENSGLVGIEKLKVVK